MPPSARRQRCQAVEKSFVAVVLILVALLAVALWQFHSLAWGEGAAPWSREPSVATTPR